MQDRHHKSVFKTARPLIKLIEQRLATQVTSSFFIGIDGRSGSGKSALAATVAAKIGSTESGEPIVRVIEGDQFYAGGSATAWDKASAKEKVNRVIDWQRQRSVLESLHHQGFAEWQVFDWDSEDWDTENIPFLAEPERCSAAPVVILEGAYSCRPELEELLDLRVLLDVPISVRCDRLLAREGETYRDDWEKRWSSAEDLYFESIVPPSLFDLLLKDSAFSSSDNSF